LEVGPSLQINRLEPAKFSYRIQEQCEEVNNAETFADMHYKLAEPNSINTID